MDKNTQVAKAIQAAPLLKPVRDVEFGCEHLQEFMSATPDVAEKLTNAYTNLQGMLAKPLEVQTTKDPKDPKKEAVTMLRPTYSCLQCNTVSSMEDRELHGHEKRHRLSIESRSGCLYCGMCDDFVYDPTFEKIRIEQSHPTTSNGRKRKISATYSQGDEDKFIFPNSNLLSCLAGAPRGMINLGQTCYMSVILQAMMHNPLMRNFFMSERHGNPKKCPLMNGEDCTACAMATSFIDILATEKIEGHGPTELLHKSWLKNSTLAGHHQQDAHEYFQSLLDQLHNSCGCVAQVYKPCECLYHRTFYGKLRSTMTCLSCKNVTVSEDPIVDLSLDIRQQIRRRKVDAKASTAETPLELSTCLKSFTSPEKLGVDAYTCKSDQCENTPQRTKKHMTIKKLPPTVCIQFKRYEHNKGNPQKLNTKVNFPLQLDMSPYTSRAHRKKKTSEHQPLSPLPVSPLNPRSPGWYDLSTVVVHEGAEVTGGHYYCFCRRDDQWFKFDDHRVTLATEAQVLDANAYLLFYIIRHLGSAAEKIAATERPNGVAEKVIGGN
ncbi:hypothetical protein MMC15_007732 [Xylographa vitiligo]|nr:hypothetical protein [Xylographa vitiligo]